MSANQNSYVPLVAGAAAGSAESLITYPTEYVKTISQLSVRTGKPGTLLYIVKDTFHSRGLVGFYGGCGPVTTGNALKAGTRFFTYETLRDVLRGQEDTLSMGRNILAGIGAGCVESIVAVTPSEVIKTRLIEAQRAGIAISGGSIGVIGTMIRTESVLSLYRGLVPTMMKQSANSAVRFASYQSLKNIALSRSGGDPLSNSTIMMMGGLAGIITVYSTMPFDVVKTRMQQSGTRYSSSLDCFVQCLRKDGPLVFWRGSAPRVTRLTVSGTVTFVIYENVSRLLQGTK